MLTRKEQMKDSIQFRLFNTFERFVLAPMITITVAIVGWSLVNIIELKEDVATVKTDIKHITKQVDVISDRIAGLSPGHPFLATFNNVMTPAKLERNWENDSD